jgi:trimethylamine--corrinoid protein Co-methyltransferase
MAESRYFMPAGQLTLEQLKGVHEATLEVLEEVGVRFHYQPSLEVLKQNGVKLKGERAFFPREVVKRYLNLAPSTFSLYGRSKSIELKVGGGRPLLAAGYGCPFLEGLDGVRRPATINDYASLVKACEVSTSIDINGGTLVEPQDVAMPTRHLDMILRTIQLTDKPFLGSVNGRVAAQDTMQLASFVRGGEEKLRRFPYTMALINSKSPLAYDARMLESLHVYVSHGQPVIIVPFVISGVSGPVTLLGTLVQHNAEALAGIVLCQMLSAGAPVVYGSATAVADMRTGGPAIGAPETALLIGAIAQLGHSYGVPVRAGGALTDTNTSDVQAGYEKMMTLLFSAWSDVDLIVHSAGILDSYMMMSLVQFVLDLEMLTYVKRLMAGMSLCEDELALAVIRRAGTNGAFLTDPHTLACFRKELLDPRLSNRTGYERWLSKGKPSINQRAARRWEELTATHVCPPLEPDVEQQVQAFIAKRKEKEGQ